MKKCTFIAVMPSKENGDGKTLIAPISIEEMKQAKQAREIMKFPVFDLVISYPSAKANATAFHIAGHISNMEPIVVLPELAPNPGEFNGASIKRAIVDVGNFAYWVYAKKIPQQLLSYAIQANQRIKEIVLRADAKNPLVVIEHAFLTQAICNNYFDKDMRSITSNILINCEGYILTDDTKGGYNLTLVRR